MKEVIKCSISGIGFTLDQDAYTALESYLEILKKSYDKTPDGPEIVADIEARIAELILSVQDPSQVIEKPLILNIIDQMGSPEDITNEYTTSPFDEPRIPRRLYRDTESGKLGGVCSGIARYFDIDPVWIRLGIFMPLLLTLFSWIPTMYWIAPVMSNLFGIFILLYLVMWFAVPAARTARQKLEMNGEKITAQSIGDTTRAANDLDNKAKPIIAEAVSIFGRIVLICMKIILGIMVFALIMITSGLIIGLFAVTISGPELLNIGPLPLLVPILGIFIALIPTVMLIYVFMCMIASRKPGARAILVFFMLWITAIIACACMAIGSTTVRERIIRKHSAIERIMKSNVVVIDNDTTSVEELLNEEQEQIEAVLDKETKTLHISVPDKKIDIIVDKNQGSLIVSETECD